MPPIPAARRSVVHVGIDPGDNGGLCLLYSSSKKIHLRGMITDELELWKYINALNELPFSVVAHLEKVSGFSGGSSRMFNFGCGYGRIRMALVAAGITFYDVTPMRWQDELGLPKKPKHGLVKGLPSTKPSARKKAHKRNLLECAKKLYPDLPVWEGTLKAQEAVCDALLIAEHGRRRYEQGTLCALKSGRSRTGKKKRRSSSSLSAKTKKRAS